MANSILSFDNCWQTPAITEYYSFQQLKKYQWRPPGFTYVAFPWATLIDLLQTGQQIPESLAKGYEAIILQSRWARQNTTLITVCQHIYAQRFSPIFKACHLQIIYWSHTTFQDSHHDGLEWRPYPLYPVQKHSAIRDGRLKELEDRKYHASFIGAFEAKYYISGIREEIFKLATHDAGIKVLIKRRENWHFQDDVYSQQIYGLKAEDAKRKQQDNHALQYRTALMESMYSLCPSGSGPNSIRLWESFSYRSIPIVFADSLALPGDQQLWLESCIFMPETSSHKEIADEISLQCQEKKSEFKARQDAGQVIEARYGINIFVWDLLQLEQKDPIITLAMKTDHDGKPIKRTHPAKILIVDPGLKNVGSHHHQINDQLAIALGHEQICVLSHQLLANANNKIAYSINPIFSYSTYDDAPDQSSTDYCIQVESLTLELTEGLCAFTGPVWLYAHTATAAQIQMIANSIELSAAIKRPQGIYLQLMFEPRSFSQLPDEHFLPRSSIRYKSALDSLTQICRNGGIPLVIETSNPIFQKIFMLLLPHFPIGIHPHLFSHTPCNPNGSDRASGPWQLLIHCGDPRPGKGLEWIAKEIEDWIKKTDDAIQFVVHIGHLRYPESFPEIAEAIEKITLIANGHPERLSLHKGYASVSEWVDIIGNTDALALLHNPEFYQYKTSGALLDYLQMTSGSRPVIVSAKTNSQEILLYYDIIHNSIDYENGDSFLQAIGQAQSLRSPNQSQGWSHLYNVFFATSNSQHLLDIMASQ